LSRFWLILISICLLGQLAGFKIWLKLFDSKKIKNTIKIWFVALNLAWFVTCALLKYTGYTEGLFWAVIGRPAISWQIGNVLLLPVLAAGIVSYGLFRFLTWIAWGRKEQKKEKTPLKSQNSTKPLTTAQQMMTISEGDPLAGKIVSKPLLGRRQFLKKAGAAVLLASASTCSVGLVRQSLAPVVAKKNLVFPTLPIELDGFRIAQISDIHLGMWTYQSELEKAFHKIAELKPDLVVLTGDLVDREPEMARLYLEPLELLDQVPQGVYAILGNHDHYTGPQKIAQILGQKLNMLVQKRVLLPDVPITMVGLDDRGSRQSWLGRRGRASDDDPDLLDFKQVMGPPFRSGDFNLLLNHRPEGYRQASREDFDLYLAGHTHGGQYQVPGFSQYNLASLFYKYSSGLYHEHPTWLNVSRGVSSVGLPFRLFAWPEIDLLTLQKA
jgi:predicted MPP superfamily phosphohydrolase